MPLMLQRSLKYCKIHGVNKVRNIALCSRAEWKEEWKESIDLDKM